MTATKALPNVLVQDPAIRQFLEAIKEIAEVGEGVRGDPLDRKLTLRDLVATGAVVLKPASQRSAGAYIQGVDLEPAAGGSSSPGAPPAPLGLKTTSGAGVVYLQWNNPYAYYSGYAHANIYRSADDNLSNAVLISNSRSHLYADHFQNQDPPAISDYYYWIKLVNTDGDEGPANAVNGVLGRNAIGEDYLESLSVNSLTGDVANFISLNASEIVVTSAMIDSVIQSTNYDANNGWAIYKSGQMLLNDVYARGDIEASSIKAGSANIVDTLMLQGQAVTFSVTSQGASTVSVGTSAVNVAQLSFTLSETTNVQLSFISQVGVDDNSSSRLGRVKGTLYIKENGTVVATLYPYVYVASTTLAYSYSSVALVGTVSLPAGTYTAYVDMKRVDGAPSANASYRTLNILALKR